MKNTFFLVAIEVQVVTAAKNATNPLPNEQLQLLSSSQGVLLSSLVSHKGDVKLFFVYPFISMKFQANKNRAPHFQNKSYISQPNGTFPELSVIF